MTDKCMLWPGRLDRHGYGIISVGAHKKAHRLIYSLFVGPIPDGMSILHSCDTPACVNPAHLRVGTAADNAADRTERNRHPTGAFAPGAKLNVEQVERIRAGMSCAEAMRAFGIKKSAYYSARSGETYR